MSVWVEKLPALLVDRDNGCAVAPGQPAGLAFPKPFEQAFGEAFIEPFTGVIGANKSRPTDAEASALQQRLDLVIELLERSCAQDGLTVDEKGRGSINLQHIHRELPRRVMRKWRLFR
jgi:hypothetical protein